MPLSPEVAHARAQVAARRRWHGDDAELDDAADVLERQALDRRIDDLVAKAPRMTPEQRDRLHRLVVPDDGPPPRRKPSPMTEWEDPPAETAAIVARYRYGSLRAELDAHPGKWAVLSRNLSSGYVRTGLAPHWKQAGYEVQYQRHQADPTRATVWVRRPDGWTADPIR